jgi:hypothetical protein
MIMANRASRSRAWKKRTSQLLDDAPRAELCADLLQAADPHWRGWSFRLTHKEPLDAETVMKTRRSDRQGGPAVLDAMLSDMLGRRTAPQLAMGPDGWTEVVDGFRSFGRLQAAKADLLDAVDPKWRELCEIYDNSPRAHPDH